MAMQEFPPLSEASLPADPLNLFLTWFDEAKLVGSIRNPEAMCLSTVSPEGFAEGRMLLLKGASQEGFSFYSHENSPKGASLKANPFAPVENPYPTPRVSARPR